MRGHPETADAAPLCPGCMGHHPPDPPDSYVDFRHRRFRPPFKCLCCGREICGRQFAFGRCCGRCDTGACQIGTRPPGPNDPDATRRLGITVVYEDGHGKSHGSTRFLDSISDPIPPGEVDRSP